MLLIMLKETPYRTSCVVGIEYVKEWYGISERTAERGYRELQAAGLLQMHDQKVSNS